MSGYTNIFALLLASFTVAVLATRLSMTLALKLTILDKPNEIKVHMRPTPRLGGLGIAFGAFLPGIFIKELHPALILGAVIIVITGAIDDRFSIKPLSKIMGQLIAGIFLASYIWLQHHSPAGVILGISAILMVLYFSNAVNLIDGLDGLAAGSSIITFAGLAVLCSLQAKSPSTSLLLVGSLSGFLIWNYPKAKTFMGDSGSLLIGYMLAWQLTDIAASGFYPFVAGLIAAGVPVYDTTLGITRRLIHRKPLFEGDRNHFYDRVNAMFNSTVKTIWTVYGVSLLFVLSGLLAYSINPASTVMVLIGIAIILPAISKQAGFLNA